MRNNPRARMLPLVMIPALTLAILLPILKGHHVPDVVRGSIVGICLGLAIVGLILMIRRGSGCAPSRTEL